MRGCLLCFLTEAIILFLFEANSWSDLWYAEANKAKSEHVVRNGRALRALKQARKKTILLKDLNPLRMRLTESSPKLYLLVKSDNEGSTTCPDILATENPANPQKSVTC